MRGGVRGRTTNESAAGTRHHHDKTRGLEGKPEEFSFTEIRKKCHFGWVITLNTALNIKASKLTNELNKS